MGTPLLFVSSKETTALAALLSVLPTRLQNTTSHLLKNLQQKKNTIPTISSEVLSTESIEWKSCSSLDKSITFLLVHSIKHFQ
jgi:uncharacterized membrane protein